MDFKQEDFEYLQLPAKKIPNSININNINNKNGSCSYNYKQQQNIIQRNKKTY